MGICYIKNKECVLTGGEVPTDADVKRACRKVGKARVYPDTNLGCAPIEPPPPLFPCVKTQRILWDAIEAHGELVV